MSHENILGTLVVVALKAQHLIDNHTFYKQDPYVRISLNGTVKRTKADPKGGQHPVWDAEFRFPISRDTSVKTRSLEISCWAEEKKEDELLGEGRVDIAATLQSGEFDDWVPLSLNGAQRGEVYLEMTFFAAGPAPLNRRQSKFKPNERLARPGGLPAFNQIPENLPQQRLQSSSASTSPQLTSSHSPPSQLLPLPQSRSPSRSPHTKLAPLPPLPEDTAQKPEPLPSILRAGPSRALQPAGDIRSVPPDPTIYSRYPEAPGVSPASGGYRAPSPPGSRLRPTQTPRIPAAPSQRPTSYYPSSTISQPPNASSSSHRHSQSLTSQPPSQSPYPPPFSGGYQTPSVSPHPPHLGPNYSPPHAHTPHYTTPSVPDYASPSAPKYVAPSVPNYGAPQATSYYPSTSIPAPTAPSYPPPSTYSTPHAPANVSYSSSFSFPTPQAPEYSPYSHPPAQSTLDRDRDLPDPYLLNRYQSPLPLPPPAQVNTSAHVASPPFDIRHVPSPGIPQPVHTPNPAPEPNTEEKIRREQEERDAELARKLDMELNLGVVDPGPVASQSRQGGHPVGIGMPGAW